MARVSHFQELERRFIPGTEERLQGSAGSGGQGALSDPPRRPGRSPRRFRPRRAGAPPGTMRTATRARMPSSTMTSTIRSTSPTT